MSEQVNEQQAVQPGAEQPQPQTDQAAAQAAAPPAPEPPTTDSEQTFPIKLVKEFTGDVHWNVAKGIWELVTHAETDEPTSVYKLVATIDGIDVPLQEFNAGGIETIVKNQQAAQSSSGS